MKNKLYFQKQKLNWNKSVKDYVYRSNFKQTRSYNKKTQPKKQFLNYDFDKMDMSVIGSLLNKKNLPKNLKQALLNILLTSAIMQEKIDTPEKEPEF